MALRALTLAVLVLAIHTTAAFAGTASVAGGTLTYTAGPGEANDVTLSVASDGGYTVIDRAGATAGPGCVQVSAVNADCGAGVTAVSVDLGDGADMGDAGSLPVPVVIHGGSGDDQLIGDGTLFGDDGNDYLVTSNGNHADVVSGGPGLDQIDAKRSDTVDCQGDLFDDVGINEHPNVVNCPGPLSFTVSTNHVTPRQLFKGKLAITVRCSDRCAARYTLAGARSLKRYIHHNNTTLLSTVIPTDDGGFITLRPPTQVLRAPIQGSATAKSLGRLKRFKLNLTVVVVTAQNEQTVRTIVVQIG